MIINQLTPHRVPTPIRRQVDRNVTIWVHTEELWLSLQAAVAPPTDPLGRFKEWNALGPAWFNTSRYSLNAMVRWARTHGIPYTDERAYHYTGTTGTVDHTTDQLTLANTTTDQHNHQ